MRDLIIVGAGLAGCSLAAAAARRGWDVLLAERRELPRHKVCGEFLSPDGVASLRALGLYHPVARLTPHPMQCARLVSCRGLTLQMPLPGEAWGISRYALDNALLTAARAAGAEVRTGLSVSHIVPEGRSFRVAVNGAWLQTRAVIAAWGRQTTPRLRAHPPPPPLRAWVGVKRHLEPAPGGSGAVELFFVDGGYVGLAPVEGGRLNCSALVSQSAFRAAGGRADGFLEAACRQNRSLAARLDGARPVPETEVTVSGVDTGQFPAPWCRSGWPLLGDAAVTVPPLVGDGMAMALRTAELTLPLAESFLRREIGLDAWAQRYSSDYRAEFARRIGLARWIQSWLVRPWAGDGLVLLGQVLPPLAALLVHATRGPLSQQVVER